MIVVSTILPLIYYWKNNRLEIIPLIVISMKTLIHYKLIYNRSEDLHYYVSITEQNDFSKRAEYWRSSKRFFKITNKITSKHCFTITYLTVFHVIDSGGWNMNKWLCGQCHKTIHLQTVKHYIYIYIKIIHMKVLN